MRTIKKTIKVRSIEQTLYNRVTKQEETKTYDIADFQDIPTLNKEVFTVLEEKVTKEAELVYTMSPETFIKYAILEV